MFPRLRNHRVALLIGGLCLLALSITALTAGGNRSIASPARPDAITSPSYLIPYQARLLDPSTGGSKPDGSYTITFGLYNAESGGSALWAETKTVAVTRGTFSTLLGDTTALSPAHFDGQTLWLGVAVNGDPEATPRQRLGHVGYAIHAEDANTAENAIHAENANTAEDADTVDGLHANDLKRTVYEGTLWYGETLALTIPHYTIFTLQLSSGWAQNGMAFIQGFESEAPSSGLPTSSMMAAASRRAPTAANTVLSPRPTPCFRSVPHQTPSTV